jgi:hypothetical protein
LRDFKYDILCANGVVGREDVTGRDKEGCGPTESTYGLKFLLNVQLDRRAWVEPLAVEDVRLGDEGTERVQRRLWAAMGMSDTRYMKGRM